MAATTMNRNVPTGPQGQRGGRGGFRGNRNHRQDYEEDVDMSTGPGPRGRNNNQTRGGFQQQGRSPAPRNPFNDPSVQRETLRRAAQNNSFQPRQNQNKSEASHAPRSSFQSGQGFSQTQSHRQGQGHNHQQQQNLRKAQVTGWRNSTASSDPDGGVQSLIKFIERHATKNKERHAEIKGFRAGKPIKIHEHQVQGDVLLVAMEQRDYISVLHVNGHRFAGIELAVTAIEDGADGAPATGAVSGTDGSIPQSLNDLPPEKVAMVAEVSRLTNLTPEYARMCLEQGNWDWQKAGELFDQAKANGALLPTAYINGVAPTQNQDSAQQQVLAPATSVAAPLAALTPEQKQEAMVAEVSQLSGMTPHYSRLALEAAAWDMEKASSKFMEIRETLPAEAWL